MGWLRGEGFTPSFESVQFEVGPESIPPALFGYSSYENAIAPAPRISRREAIQVPAVKRARDLIAGTLGALPINVLGKDNELSENWTDLFEQPEKQRTRTVTMTKTFEDVLFEGVSWWRVVERGWHGYPTSVVRLEPRSVQIKEDSKAYVSRDGSQQGQAWEYVEDRDLIRFDSPSDALLDAGARAIRTCLKLDTATARYADEPMPQGWFSPVDNADPVDTEEVQDMLDDWKAARQTRSTAYIPAALNYQTAAWNPEQMQMAEARQHAVLEIARTVGLDPEDLGVSTTSRTYQNAQDRRLAMINDVLGMYASAVFGRLSMGDVTPRGYRVEADFNGFLRADDKTRLETYQIGVDMGLYDLDAVAAREGLPTPPGKPTPPPAPALPNLPQPRALPASASPEPLEASVIVEGQTFDTSPSVFGFDTEETRNAFEVDAEKRTIYGLAVPYGVAANKAGQAFQFSKGSLTWTDPSRVKLLVQHDRTQAIGKAIELEDTDAGLWAKFKVARGPEGDKALSMAEDGVWDGLSIGLADGGKFSKKGNVQHSISNALAEISLTPHPAFSDARVSAVAAEADQRGSNAMECTICGKVHAEGAPACAPAATAPQFDMDAFMAALGDKFEIKPKEVITPPAVVPVGAPTFEVNEALPYTFDADRGFLTGGEHDFSADLVAASKGDYVANQRVLGFMGEALEFAVTTTNATNLNPSKQRPDLYVDQRQYQYPLWAAVRKESLSDVTPIVLPKYNSHSGLVAAHTEGTEPAAGAFSATSQTITPGAMSGKAEITRELWDQAGNPRVSNLIWNKMVMGWFEALEAKVVATFVAAAASITDITLTTAGVNAALSTELANAIAALQYVRGGFRFDTLAVQIDLYQKLASAVTTTGEPLFPMISPNNRNGEAAAKFASMNVHGVDAFPEWALAATGSVAASSWLFDRESVWAAASTPDRLDWNFGATVQSSNLTQIANVTIGIWGYSAAAILDLAGCREIVYDPI